MTTVFMIAIGVLIAAASAFVLISYGGESMLAADSRAEAARLISESAQMQHAFELYYHQVGKYPAAGEDADAVLDELLAKEYLASAPIGNPRLSAGAGAWTVDYEAGMIRAEVGDAEDDYALEVCRQARGQLNLARPDHVYQCDGSDYPGGQLSSLEPCCVGQFGNDQQLRSCLSDNPPASCSDQAFCDANPDDPWCEVDLEAECLVDPSLPVCQEACPETVAAGDPMPMAHCLPEHPGWEYEITWQYTRYNHSAGGLGYFEGSPGGRCWSNHPCSSTRANSDGTSGWTVIWHRNLVPGTRYKAFFDPDTHFRRSSRHMLQVRRWYEDTPTTIHDFTNTNYGGKTLYVRVTDDGVPYRD